MTPNKQGHNLPNSSSLEQVSASTQIYIPKDPNPKKVDVAALVEKAKRLVTIIEDREEARRMEEEKKQKESKNTVPELEEEDFKIKDTSNWKVIETNIGKVKVNKEGDIWEYQEGKFPGEQKFTQGAALRETKKAGYKMPNNIQWKAIMKSINPNINFSKGWQNDTSIREKLKLKLSGYRNASIGAFRDVGDYGNYWSFDLGYDIGGSTTQVCPLYDGNTPDHGLSVRCLKN